MNEKIRRLLAVAGATVALLAAAPAAALAGPGADQYGSCGSKSPNHGHQGHGHQGHGHQGHGHQGHQGPGHQGHGHQGHGHQGHDGYGGCW